MIDRSSALSGLMQAAAHGHAPTTAQLDALPIPPGHVAAVFRSGVKAVAKQVVELHAGGSQADAGRLAASTVATHQAMWADHDEEVPAEPTEDPRVLAARVRNY